MLVQTCDETTTTSNMSAPSGGRRRFLGLLLVFLLGFVTLVGTEVEAVPATDERSHRLPRWIDGLWKKIRSGYDSVSSSSDYTGTTSSGESVYRFLGLDEDVMHHFKTFLSPANPASMMVFEHRSIIFWMVTQVFTDADGALMSGQAGHLYIYAVWGNQMQSTIVETNGAVKCEVFLKAIDFVDFVCAERLYQHQHFESTKNGSGVYRMTWHDKLEVTLRRPLPTHSVRDLLVWRYEDHALIAFLNTLEVRTLYGGLQVDGLTQVASDIFRHRSMMVEGRLFTSYNHLEKAAFITKHARGFAKLVIGSRHFLAVANFMGKDGNTETHSDIFVYESGVGTRLFQRVRTSAARSFASFTFRSAHKEEHFLVVANEYSVNAVNNIRFDANTLLLTDKEQTITSEYTMQALGARTARLQLLNGRDITTFLQQLVLNNTNTAITGHVIVRGDVIANSIQTTGSVQPLDPQDIARRALLHSTQNTQIVTGIHTVGGVSMEGGLRVVGTLNGLSIPRDVYLRSSNETVNRPVTFNSLQANSVQVLSRLGDVRVLNGELDVLLVHGDQQVSGRKVFTEMVLLGHSSVSLTVSGHRLRDLEKNTLIQDLLVALQSMCGRSIMGEVRFEGRVDVVDAVLGGANVTHMFLFGLPLHTTSIPATFVFEGPVRIVGDTRVTNHLNGKRVDLYALLAGTHTFTRQVTFTSDLVAEGHVHVATTVNGINLQELHRVLALLSSTVTVTNLHDITLHSPSFRGGLEVRRGGSVVVAGLDLQDVVMRDTDAIITGLKTMPAVQVATAAAGHVEVLPGGRVDGVVLEDLFFANSLRKTAQGTQQIVGGSLGVVVAASVTGTQLGAFERSVVYRDTASERLGGSLRFNGQVTIQDLSFNVVLEGTINGLQVNSDFVVQGRQAVISGRKTFAHLTILGNLSMVEGGTVQGVDVSELSRLAARKTGQGQVIVVPGLTTLQSLNYVGSNFLVEGRVDGVVLRRDTVLLRTVEQVMSGTLEVTAGDARLPAVVAPLLVVLDNRFNGVEFDRLQNMTVRMDRRVVIQNNVVFQGMCRFTSLAIRSQLVNGVHLRELAELINADYLLNLGNHLGAVLHAARSTREVMAVKGAEIWYYEELPFQKLSKLIAVTLRSDTLVFGVHDSLVGIDMTNDAVYTYRMDVPFPALYPAVKVLEPIAVAGLGSGLLATCGRLAMDATPAGTHQLPNFQVIHLQGGTGTGYGHIYSLEANGGVLAAFETRECRDLVSFQLQDGRVCVAVLNYRAPTIILCGTASTGFHLLTRLDTTRATKGVWVSFQGAEYLLVGQEPSQTEAGVLALYKYDHSLSRMVLVSEAHEPVSSHVVATVLGDAILVAVTGKRTPLCDTFVEVYLTNTTDIGHNLQGKIGSSVLANVWPGLPEQRLEVPEAVHSSLLHLHTGEVVLMVQTRHSLYHYYLRGTKFVFVREMNTASSLCPWSTPFLAGDPRTLHIAYAGLGAYQEDYKGAKLLPVSTTIYRAVYRGPSFDTLYRGSSHLSSSLHAHPPSTSYSISYGSTPHYRS
ncbi:hypothetical protein E2C01_016545 [Portunus trituberculatus]|uniref:Uncharacterized protein n=1 Tax=Portunus trituberculatus TaxID=210409 RepID=A0A5B7DQI7_PORTR|nr:hypothetical protein [Portunus trituberculatus]